MQLLDTPPCDPFIKGEHPVVVIRLFSYQSDIKIELDPSAAPITVANFLMLAQQGFYDGLKFHRLAPGFIVQGGCPLGTGDGETEFYLKGEFSSNGVDNPIQHKKGVISMARQDDPDTASCQFYIMLADAPFLDGQYAAFGHVIEGMDVLESIERCQADAWERPLAPLIMTRVYVE